MISQINKFPRELDGIPDKNIVCRFINTIKVPRFKREWVLFYGDSHDINLSKVVRNAAGIITISYPLMLLYKDMVFCCQIPL
ncbi:MAG: hypothetical protein L6Q66_11655 [Bacteroidia bacterium]|nr:hypothetical protein [Bacteroidia bacterium]